MPWIHQGTLKMKLFLRSCAYKNSDPDSNLGPGPKFKYLKAGSGTETNISDPHRWVGSYGTVLYNTGFRYPYSSSPFFLVFSLLLIFK